MNLKSGTFVREKKQNAMIDSTKHENVFKVLDILFVGYKGKLIDTDVDVGFFLPKTNHFLSFTDDDKI